MMFDYLPITAISIAVIFMVIACGIFWIARWSSKVDMRIESLEDQVRILANAVNDIRKQITTHFDNNAAESKSPLALTKYGQELSEEIKADALVERYAEKIRNNVGDMNTYEIQEYCFKYADDKLLLDIKENDVNAYNSLTDFAYNKGLDTKKIMRVLGVMLRDKLLEINNRPHKKVRSA